MLKSESRVIGAYSYTVTQLGAVQGRAVFTRLAKAVGPAIALLSDGKADGATVFAKLAEGLTETDLNYLCDTFGAFSTVKIGEKNPRVFDMFDLHFAGNYGEMISWLAFCLEVNFASFFDGLGLRLRSAKKADSNPPPSKELSQAGV